VKANIIKLRYIYLHLVWFDKHEDVMISALGFLEVHQHMGTVFFVADVQNLSLMGSDEILILAFHQEF